MSNPTTLLSRTQIDKINSEALTAVARGRETLASAREARARIGLTDEKLQQMFAALPPDSRAWVSTATRAGLKALEDAGAETAKRRPRKSRTLV